MPEWSDAIQKLIAYIDENAIHNPSLSEIAAQIGYSPYYCSEVFHKLSGLTIREYMAMRRVYSAANLLRNTDRSIIEIALDCGFSSQQALQRAFKKYYGCQPHAYRKNPNAYTSTIDKEIHTVIEFRRVFDTIPEQFDKYRPRYCTELFNELIAYAQIAENKTVLELGPGTGQATDPILNTGCQYTGIELGENFAGKLQEKYSAFTNFHLINDDFLIHDFGDQKFDMIYSAATIQWMPEKEAFTKTFELLKPGGVLAMMYTFGEYKTPNPQLYENIQKIYSEHFRPAMEYKHGRFRYDHAKDYGFIDWEVREYPGVRVFTADEYVAMCGTHCDHIVIPEPHRTPFFSGLRNAVLEAGNRIEFRDIYRLMLVRKPL